MSLLKEIFERLDYMRLIEEGRDPVEVLHFKYKHVPEAVIDKVISIDPTNKKSYSQWLLSKWDNEKDTILHNLKNGRIANMFKHFKEHSDIQIKDCPSVEDGLRYVPEVDTVLVKSDEPTTYLENEKREVDSDLANDFDIVFEEDNWLIAIPHTYEAECKLGENMQWCTANGFGHDGRSYYKRYLSDYGGEYYVNFDMSRGEDARGKDYPYTRYQFHFESKQYCDKNDERVNILEIGMPQSAIEFYEERGHSMNEDDVMDEEAREEAYIEQRWGDKYVIVENELYLLQEYDVYFEFEPGGQNTEYFIYDDNDITDPLIYKAIPNPHLNEVIILRRDNYILLTSKHDPSKAIIAISTNESGYYRDWSCDEINCSSYLELPDGNGIFARDENGHFCAYTTSGVYESDKYSSSPFFEIYLNKELTDDPYNVEGILFIEVVEDNFHTLYSLDTEEYELNCVIGKDIPVGGELFTADDNGIVSGEFQNHLVFFDEEYNKPAKPRYELVKKLKDGSYVVSRVFTENTGLNAGKRRQLQNVVKNSKSEPILSSWVKEVVDIYHNVYMTYGLEPGVLSDYSGATFFRYDNGQQLGSMYYTCYEIDKERGIIAGKVGDRHSWKECHLINTENCTIMTGFTKLLTQKPVDGVIMVLREVSEGQYVNEGYNYLTGEVCYPFFESMSLIINDFNNIYFCKWKDKDCHCIFDFNLQKVVVDDITTIKSFLNRRYMLKIIKTNGKITLYDWANSKEYLSFGVDDVTSINTDLGLVDYQLNGRYYLYNYKNDNLLLTTNGFDYPFYIAEYQSTLTFQGNNYNVTFSYSDFYDTSNVNITSLKPIRWGSGHTQGSQRYGIPVENENIPPEVIEMTNNILAQIQGNQQQLPQQQAQEPNEESAYAVAENFRRFVKRIDEAAKLKYNDILD